MILISFDASAQDSMLALSHNLETGFKGVKYTDNSLQLIARDPEPSYKKRQLTAGAATVMGIGGSFILLNQAWYKGYPRSSFHTFSDGSEWKQMDKIGHAWTAYSVSRATSSMWKWAGMNDKNSIILGAGSSLAFLLSIEYLDGRSAEWGWSWADVGADFFGAALFAGQQLGWKEQRVLMKFSAHREKYEPSTLQQRADELFGKSLPERLLKDYNTQAYWLSFNLSSFLPQKKLPAWLNFAFGYGANGMFGGYENLATDKNGMITFDRRDIKRYRQWYLAPDIDLSRIKTKSRFLRTTFSILNVIKLPSPALEFSNNKFKLRALVF